ncbi:MAG: DMT family transporter [Cyanobacteria bacterium]|nr:DMT family transporter [Cyanobacteriota bacterium]
MTHHSSNLSENLSELAQPEQKRMGFPWGPICVGLGTALWGTEFIWRVTLNKSFPNSDVIVMYEHVYCLLFSLPVLFFFREKLKGVAPRTWLFLLGSGVIGSALGTFFFTDAIKTVNLSVANLLLNIQPLFGAMYARIILKERFGKGFYLWAGVAIIAMVLLALKQLTFEGLTFKGAVWEVLVTSLCWSFGTVAGRATNLGMSYTVAAPIRFCIGLVAMAVIVYLNGHWTDVDLNIPAFDHWETHQEFLFLSTVAGVIPLFLYFKGLATTNASVASFLEMLQVVSALVITWGFFHETLEPHQIVGGVLLLITVYFINNIQRQANLSVDPRTTVPHEVYSA